MEEKEKVAPVEEQGEEVAAETQLAAEDAGTAPEAAEEETPEAAEDEVAEEVEADAPVEGEAAEDVVLRDPTVPVEVDEVLTEQEVVERANYLVANPDERTAYDPYPADGQPVGDRNGNAQ